MRARLWICSTTLLLPLAACAGADEVSTPAASPGPSTAAASPSATPSPVTETPEPEPEPEPTLTFKNSRDLAILLEGPSSGRSVGRFASRNEGVAIEFDAHVVAVTEAAVQLEYGDHDAARRTGPTFELPGTAVAGLGLEGVLSEDDEVHLVARVESFESDNRVLLLDPMSITLRG